MSKSPNLINAHKLSNIDSYDTFMVSSSFEDRCLAVSNHINQQFFDRSLIFRNVDFENKIIENSNLIKQKLFNIKNSEFIDLKINDPKYTFLNINKKIHEVFKGGYKNCLIDITTFTHESLLMLLRALIKHKRNKDKITFIYNSAKDYSYREQNKEKKWLTKGVKDTRSIIGYPGYFDPSQKSHLVILFGFERERTIRLIDEFEYDYVSLAYADQQDSISKTHQQINEERHNEILKLYSNAKQFKISLKNPIETKIQILSYIEQSFSNGKENIVLAPMNNKLSTIGAGLAAVENPDIQLCYLQPNSYNIESYSIPNDEYYIWQYC